jgi:cytochrome c-type biogenesis protein CcmH/NrfF
MWLIEVILDLIASALFEPPKRWRNALIFLAVIVLVGLVLVLVFSASEGRGKKRESSFAHETRQAAVSR